MATLSVKRGNLLQDLTDGEDFLLVHQVNCHTNNGRAAGVAHELFDRWPAANVYRSEEHNITRIGGVEVRSVQAGVRVAALFAQRWPGGPRSGSDSRARRLGWFESALNDLMLYVGPKTCVRLPYRIGCGLARGNWAEYWPLIEAFAARCPASSRVDVCRLGPE